MTAAPILVPFWLDLVATLVLTLVLARIAWVDAATRRIPDALSLPLLLCGLVLAGMSPAPALAERLLGAGSGFLLFAVLGAGYFRLTQRDGLGLGDAKLFAAAGAWLGWQALPLVLLCAASGGLVWAWRSGKPGELAFGPWLGMAFWVGWLVSLLRQI